MLQSNPQSLPLETQEQFLKFLSNPQIQTLIKVAESKVIELELKALTDMGQSKDAPRKLDTAHGQLQESYRYRNFIEVLREIVNQPKHQTITVTYASNP